MAVMTMSASSFLARVQPDPGLGERVDRAGDDVGVAAADRLEQVAVRDHDIRWSHGLYGGLKWVSTA